MLRRLKKIPKAAEMRIRRPGSLRRELVQTRKKLVETRKKLVETRKKLAKTRKKQLVETRKKLAKTRKKQLVETRKKLAETREKLRLQSRLLEAQTHEGPAARPAPGPEEASLYLDLMKRCLSGWVYADSGKFRREDRSFDARIREEGRDWPQNAHTTIGLKRLDNLQACVEDVLHDDIPGDLIETGVWRGGATIFIRAILKAYGVKDRRVWVADSFEGLPPPNPEKFLADKGDKHHLFEELAVPLEEVKDNFARYGLLDEQVCFLKGWFRDTLPDAPIERLAVIRLDGDMYESTMDALVNLYPKLSPGGYLIVDDYGAVRGCRKAVHDYRDLHSITEEIVPVDWAGVFWRRER